MEFLDLNDLAALALYAVKPTYLELDGQRYRICLLNLDAGYLTLEPEPVI